MPKKGSKKKTNKAEEELFLPNKPVRVNKKKLVESVNKNTKSPDLFIKNTVKDLVKQELEATKSFLTPYEEMIARDYASGKSQYEIILEHKISVEDYKKLILEPAFIEYYKEYLITNTYANKDMLSILNNNIISKLFEEIENRKDLGDINSDKLVELLRKQMEFQSKNNSDNQVTIKVDITQLINDDVKSTRKINEKVESKYPTINNETGKLEGNFEEIIGYNAEENNQ